MPRFNVATLTVDQPASEGRAEMTAEWLREHAKDLESETNLYTTGTFKARRFNPNNYGQLRAVNQLKIRVAGHLSHETRKRIAKWLRSRADYLVKHNATAVTSRRGWFRQDFSL